MTENNKNPNYNQNKNEKNMHEISLNSEFLDKIIDSNSNIALTDIDPQINRSKKGNNDNKQFNPNLNVNKKNSKEKVDGNVKKTDNNPNIKEKENDKDDKKNNEKNKINKENNFQTPTGDPEIEKYYKELEKEKDENKENNSQTPTGDPEIEKYYKELEKEKDENKENNKNMINSYCIINDNIEKEKECIGNGEDSSLKTYTSLGKFKKAPNVILETGENSSYLNCVIYCLANCKNLASYYLKELNTFKFHIKDMPLSYYFSRIIFHFYPYPENPLQKSFSLSTFHKILIHLNLVMFKDNYEKNVIDFLIYLLEQLHEDDVKIRNNNIDNKNRKMSDIKKFKDYIKFISENEKSCILDNFCWVNQKIKKCIECKSEYITYQKFFAFNLYIENIYNLNKNIDEIKILDCINHQIKKNTINEQYCINCQKKTSFDFESLISVSPQYFIFLINLDDKNMNEILPKIKIEEEIYLSEIVKEQTSVITYFIQGIIFYDLDIKKYLAYCRNPIDNKWYHYKKDSILPVDKKKVFTYIPYKMFPVIIIYNQD